MKRKRPTLIPSIYVDLDDVVAETLRTFARVANEMYGKAIQFENIYSFDLAKSFDLDSDDLKAFMHAAHSREVLLYRISPNPQAQAILAEWASLGTHVTVVTGRPISTYQTTLDWLRKNEIPFHALRFLRKYGRNDLGEAVMRPLDIRTLPHAGFLFSVEDSIKMAKYLANRARVPVLLLDKPWNRDALDIESSTLVTRCSDWNSIRAKSLAFLESARYRETG